jgi:ribosomal subunit interface protein
MDIRVSGHQVETGDALRTHVGDRLGGMASKYVAHGVSAQVTFGKGPHGDFACDIVMPAAQGMVLKASNRAGDAHVAFEGAADKVETQLRRYNKRLKSRRTDRGPALDEMIADNAAYRLFAEPPADGGDEIADEAESGPAIVAETRVDIPDASPGEAVMMLDWRNTNALMFRNRLSGDYNMVYRRGNGTIGWVEPQAG